MRGSSPSLTVESLSQPPMTVPGSSVIGEEEVPADLESGDLIDLDENTGADMKAPVVDLESTLARPNEGEDEIVIADDLAEIVEDSAKKLPADDDDEEHTDQAPLPRIPES
jgi:hypothetical protein